MSDRASPHGPDRERRLADTFVVLADTLVADFDLGEVHGRLTQACVEVLGAAAAGILLADARGGLGVVAASSDDPALTAVLEVQRDDGPGHDCHRTGEPVPEVPLDDAARLRWPVFTPLAVAAGHRTVGALPLRLRGRIVGALTIAGSDTRSMAAADVRIAQALADVATIALLQQRAVNEGETLAEQLQTALTTRVVVEQAKGLLAERGGISVDEAFTLLRRWCRGHQLTVGDVARALVEGRQDADDVLDAR